MNDFTKKELEWLYEDIDIAIKEYSQPDIAYKIRDKLKVMIDNYDSKGAYRLWLENELRELENDNK